MIDALARSTEVGREPEGIPIIRTHLHDSVMNRLQKRDSARDNVDVELELVTLFFTLMQRLFIRIVLMGDKT